MRSLNPMLLRSISLLRLRLHHHRPSFGLPAAPKTRKLFCTESIRAVEESSSSSAEGSTLRGVLSVNGWDDPDYCKWKDKECEIVRDVEPIVLLAKEILHSDRYMDGEQLTAEDEKVVVERLLAYHPHSQDKIGCGMDSIMVHVGIILDILNGNGGAVLKIMKRDLSTPNILSTTFLKEACRRLNNSRAFTWERP